MDELIVKQSAGTIEFNFDEIKEQVTELTASYEALVVTEDSIKGAKKDLADLRKMKKEVDDRRKEVKAVFMKPYEEFETKVKEIQAIIEKPISLIDTQLKDFEAKRIAEKQAHIVELYEANIEDLKDILPLEKVRKPQWDNATYKDSDIIYDISEKKQHIKSDLMVIESLKSEIEAELKEAYVRSNFDLSVAVKKNSDYQDAKKLAEERLKAEEERKRKEEEEKRLQEALQAQKEALQKEAEEKVTEEVKVEDVSVAAPDKATFTVYGEDISKVVDFLEFSEIRYERG